MGTGEPADVKPGTAFPGKERSGPRRLLDVAPVWTISNSTSPFTCKALGDREVQSCSTRGSVWWFGRDLCVLCPHARALPPSTSRRRSSSRKRRAGKMALKCHRFPSPPATPLPRASLPLSAPYSRPQNSHQPTDLWVPATACAQEFIPGS